MAKKNFKDIFKPTGRVESLYLTLLNNLLAPVKKAVMKAAQTGDMTKVSSLLEKASKSRLFKKKSDEIAKKIVTLELETQSRTWRQAANKASNPEIYRLLTELLEDDSVKKQYDEIIEQNAKIIKTLPLDISRGVVKHVSRQQLKGKRPEEIAKEIRQFFPEHSKAKEKLIARTESSKCKEAITKIRSEKIGIKWAIWVSVDDQRTRPAHAYMNDVIFHFNHPPSPEGLAKKAGKYKGKVYGHYGPGNIFNCRCYAEPIISLVDVKWPAKVYDWKKDSLVTMNKEQFKEFAKLHRSYSDSWDKFDF